MCPDCRKTFSSTDNVKRHVNGRFRHQSSIRNMDVQHIAVSEDKMKHLVLSSRSCNDFHYWFDYHLTGLKTHVENFSESQSNLVFHHFKHVLFKLSLLRNFHQQGTLTLPDKLDHKKVLINMDCASLQNSDSCNICCGIAFIIASYCSLLSFACW